MEFAASLAPWTHFSAAFLDISNCALYEELEIEARQPCSRSNKEEKHWLRCSSNPVNKIDDYVLPATPRWRVDGCSSGGTQYFVLPVFLSPKIVPRRIDVFIPDQSQHPPALRRALRSGEALFMTDSRVNNLGICQFILAVLEHWSSRYDFGEILRNVPFGSRIVIGNITASVANARLRVLPNSQLDRQLLSISELQALWNFPSSLWPAEIDLDELAQLSQIHDSISVVRVPRFHGEKCFVFKSSTHSYKYIYHELKLLLSMPENANITKRPVYIVTAPVSDGDDLEKKVFGFVLEYIQGSTLARSLTHHSQSSLIKLEERFRWARQITEALIFVQDGPAKYYSELKPDNILVNDDGNIILIDFEQHANWDAFSAPEIHHIDNLEKAIQVRILPKEVRRQFQQLLKRHAKILPTNEPAQEIYSNPEEGYFLSWVSLSPARRELAMVFALGKILWCIFEGCDHTRNSLLEEYTTPTSIEFPAFQNTPTKLRGLIMRCTAGFEACTGGDEDIVRLGDRFYARSRQETTTLQHDDGFSAAKDAMETAQTMWKRRVREMEKFLDSKTRFDQGVASEEDISILGFPQRPTLSEVLRAILDAEQQLKADFPSVS